MLPLISPLFGSKAPKDIKIQYFSSLTVSELCKSSQVCKEWFNLSREKVIWIPIFKELNHFSNREFVMKKGEDIKSEVLEDLKSNQKRADLIISLIDNNEQLASFINNTSLSLTDLKKMLPIERTMHVMRGLKKDCTQFLVHLVKKHKNGFNEHRAASLRLPHANEQAVKQGISDFYKYDKSLSCWVDLINGSFGPFDAAVVMSASLPLCLFNPCEEAVLPTIATIVKAHQDLSSFFKINVHLGDSFEEQKFLSMTVVVSSVLMPTMQELGLDVSWDDWIKCGYKPDNGQSPATK